MVDWFIIGLIVEPIRKIVLTWWFQCNVSIIIYCMCPLQQTLKKNTDVGKWCGKRGANLKMQWIYKWSNYKPLKRNQNPMIDRGIQLYCSLVLVEHVSLRFPSPYFHYGSITFMLTSTRENTLSSTHASVCPNVSLDSKTFYFISTCHHCYACTSVYDCVCVCWGEVLDLINNWGSIMDAEFTFNA